jgi:hypothetical protein
MTENEEFFKSAVNSQKLICDQFKTQWEQSSPALKVGVSRNLREGVKPIHGLRHPPIGDTSGWYLWAGEYSEDPDFFISLHVGHLVDWRPEVIKYLGLPAGWRFLIADNHVDVWEDEKLLNV